MSNGIKRYDAIGNWDEIREQVDGDYVLFTDAEAAIAAKDAEIADLKHDIEQLQKIATAEATLVGEIAEQVRGRLIRTLHSQGIYRGCKAIRTADLTDLVGKK